MTAASVWRLRGGKIATMLLIKKEETTKAAMEVLHNVQIIENDTRKSHTTKYFIDKSCLKNK